MRALYLETLLRERFACEKIDVRCGIVHRGGPFASVLFLLHRIPEQKSEHDPKKAPTLLRFLR